MFCVAVAEAASAAQINPGKVLDQLVERAEVYPAKTCLKTLHVVQTNALLV